MTRSGTLLTAAILLAISSSTWAQDSLSISKVSELRYDWDYAYDVAVEGDYAYVADYYGGLKIVDINDPDNPVQVGSFEVYGRVEMVRVDDVIAVIYGNQLGGWNPVSQRYMDGLIILNVSDPSQPRQLAVMDSVYNVYDMAIQGSYAYITADDFLGLRNLLFVLDLSDPEHPQLIATVDPLGRSYEMELVGDWLFVATSSAIEVYDISDPLQISRIGGFGNDERFEQIAIADNYALLEQSNDLYLVDISDPDNMSETARIENVPGDIYDLAGTGDKFYLAMGDDGMLRLDISDPENPVLADTLATLGSVASLAVSGDYILQAAGRAGLRMIDVADPENLTETSYYVKPGYCTNVSLEGDMALLANNQGGLRLIDVSTPAQPNEVGIFPVSDDDFIIDAQSSGGLIFSTGDNLKVIDATDPEQPELIGYDLPVDDNNSSDYSRIAFSGNHLYRLEDGLLSIFDVRKPARPARIGSLSVSTNGDGYGNSEPALGLFVEGDLAYLACREGGLRIYDVSRPSAIELLGYHSTYWDVHDVVVRDGIAFLGAAEYPGGGLLTLDVGDPLHPYELSFLSIPGACERVVLVDDFAFIAAGEAGLRIVNISDPEAPEEVGFFDTPGFAGDVEMDGRYAYVADYKYFGIYDCAEAIGGDERDDVALSSRPLLSAPYPNPCNGATTIRYALPEAARVTLTISDLSGRLVETLVNGELPAGNHNANWNAGNQPTGIYFYTIKASDFTTTRRLALVK